MNPTKGILFKVCALFLFAIMASLIKAASENVPPWQAVFFRAFFAMPIILLWLAQRGDLRTGLRVTNAWGHFWRGVIGTTAMAFGFAGLGLLPFPEVTAIGFASPFFTLIFAAILLGERFRVFRIGAVVVGLIGVAIILYPRITVFGEGGAASLALLGAIFTLTSAAFRALAQIHIRRLVQTDQTAAIVFYFSLTSTVLALLTIPLGWVMPTRTEFMFLIGAGLVGGVAQILLTTGYRYSEASTLAPFDYTSMIFAVLIGYFVFSEIPTSNTIWGSAIIIAAGITIIWRERQLGLKRGKARPSVTPQG